jgi:hypothetical protein
MDLLKRLGKQQRVARWSRSRAREMQNLPSAATKFD